MMPVDTAAYGFDPAFLASVQGERREGAIVLHLDGVPVWVRPKTPLVPKRVYQPGETVEDGAALMIVDGIPKAVLSETSLAKADLAFRESDLPNAFRRGHLHVTLLVFDGTDTVPSAAEG